MSKTAISAPEPSNDRCPHCGYCPHCGRDKQTFVPYPVYPVYPVYPYTTTNPWTGTYAVNAAAANPASIIVT